MSISTQIRMGATLVHPRLWLGSRLDAEDVLKNPDSITVVVTVAWDSPVKGHYVYGLTDPGSLVDDPALYQAAATKVIELLTTTDKDVLVHCFSGMNRSTSVVLGVLMKLNKWTVLEAYNHVKALRPFIWPFPRHLYQANIFNGINEEVDVEQLPNWGSNE